MTLLCKFTYCKVIYLHQIVYQDCSSSLCFDSKINIIFKISALSQKSFKLEKRTKIKVYGEIKFSQYILLTLPVLKPLVRPCPPNIEFCFAFKNVSHPRIEIDICIHIIPLYPPEGFHQMNFPQRAFQLPTASLQDIYTSGCGHLLKRILADVINQINLRALLLFTFSHGVTHIITGCLWSPL